MAVLRVPARWYDGADYCQDVLELELARTAFMVVDSDSGGNPRIDEGIAPALSAARAAGLRTFFVHNDYTLVDEPGSIRREIHGTNWGDDGAADRPPMPRAPTEPVYPPSIQPLAHEPDFPKGGWSGFHRTDADRFLRCHDIKNLIATGFTLRSCLYQTLADAVQLNYRAVLLRDCTSAGEYPDTVDESLPEGGWVSRIMLRNFEHVIGYTSTSAEFVNACQSRGREN